MGSYPGRAESDYEHHERHRDCRDVPDGHAVCYPSSVRLDMPVIRSSFCSSYFSALDTVRETGPKNACEAFY